MGKSKKSWHRKEMDSRAKQEQQFSRSADKAVGSDKAEAFLNRDPLSPGLGRKGRSSKSSSLPKWKPSGKDQDLKDMHRLRSGLQAGDPKALAESMLRSRLGAPSPLGENPQSEQTSYQDLPMEQSEESAST